MQSGNQPNPQPSTEIELGNQVVALNPYERLYALH